MNEKGKKLAKAIAIAGAATSATYLLVGNLFYLVTLTRKGIESPLADMYAKTTDDGDEWKKHLDDMIDDGKKWFEEQAKKEKIVISSTHFKKNLHADYVIPDKESNIFVILVHGYTSSPGYMGVYSKHYYEQGYNVISPSLNGHADSEKQNVTMGWNDRLDVLDWANYISETYPDSKIVIHGVSMGAATTMMALGEDLPTNVKVAVADCGYTSVWDIFDNKIRSVINIPGDPILHSANTVNKVVSHFDFKKASAVEQLKKATVPTIFIHGDKDTFVPYEMLDQVYDAAACEKEKVTIPNAPHARNACVDPELYWGSVERFISKHIND